MSPPALRPLRSSWLWRALLGGAALALAGAGTGVALRYELFRAGLDLPGYSHLGGRTRRLTVRMRDGVALNTQVYLPAGPGPFPTVLIRNPYNFGDAFGFLCGVFVRYGYACVHQDVRGRMGSEGRWVPLEHERNDGIDTLQWLTAMPFQDGNIAMYGMSYLAAVQWSVADVLPPEVKTLIPMVFGTDAYSIHYRGGMYRLEIFTAWASMMPGEEMRFDHGDEYASAIVHRPHVEVDERFFGRRLPWYRQWITNPDRTSPVWQRPRLLAFQTMPERVSVPVLMIGGWYDFFLPAMLDDFRRLRTRASSRMVIGPWHHLQRAEVPPPGDTGLGGQWREVLAWLDHHLRGAPLRTPTGVIHAYGYGDGRWHTHDRFPPDGLIRRVRALTDLSAAPTCEGGRLAERPPPEGEPPVDFRYDPDHPVPAQGGAAMLAFAFRTYDAVEPGPRPLDEVCQRQDVLTFAGPALSAPVRLLGAPIVDLKVSSDAPDTAFTAKLIEVRPDGTAVHVREGIRSLAYRVNLDGPAAAYAPGTVVDLRIEMTPVDWTFPRGSRIRLDVSSSSFPVYHAHPNRSGVWSRQTGADVATNRLHDGGRLTLPVRQEPY